MFENLEVFKMAHAMAVHAGQKQAVVAQNVANSDTPEYKAQSIADFADQYQNSSSQSIWFGQKSTRDTHLHGLQSNRIAATYDDPSGVGSPNGNTVSLETEMLKSLDAKRQHDRAMAIYKSTLGILRSTLSRS